MEDKGIPIVFWNASEQEESVPDVLRQKYAHVDTKITFFFSPAIIASALFLAAILTYGQKMVIHFFVAGEVPLNTMICVGIFFSLYHIIANILKMRKSAFVLKKIEAVADKPDITIEDVNGLHNEIIKNGYIINTKNTAAVIDKMLVYGNLSFSNEEARLIKAKVGQRCDHMRQSVGFLAGLMIMLGLLGTYLGLLETIDKVGQAMASMANIGGESPDAAAAPSGDTAVSGDQMSGFISSIAAPLQGMGLAFSASLFGIGGSLIVSYFNFLAGHVQNHFIENVSRWIDERIPESGGSSQGGGARGGGDADLKNWLSNFAQLSQKTHKKLGQLIIVMSHTLKVMVSQKGATDQMGQRQAEMSNALMAIQQHVQDFKAQHQEVSAKSEQFLRDAGRTMAEHTGNISQNIKAVLQSVEAQEVAAKTLTGAVQDLRVGIDGVSRVETAVAAKLGEFKDSPAAQSEAEIANLVWQVNTLLDEVSRENEKKLGDTRLDSESDTDI